MLLSEMNSLIEPDVDTSLLSDLRVLTKMVDNRDLKAAPNLATIVKLAFRFLDNNINDQSMRMLHLAVKKLIKSMELRHVQMEPVNSVARQKLSMSGKPWVHRHVYKQLQQIDLSLSKVL